MKHIVLAALLLSNSVVAPALGGSVEVAAWRGYTVVQLSGVISPNTANDVSNALDRADIWPHGAVVLLLDSPGGSVDEALKVSSVLNGRTVHTVVPDGARCASACASIIFIAGTYRTVGIFGALGQHSCSRGGIADEVCNEAIVAHALEHGVSRGAIASFVSYAAPSEMIWFDRDDADGWGLTRYPGENKSEWARSEPRFMMMLLKVGRGVSEIEARAKLPAQAVWRLDFRADGYKAFVRTTNDDLREMQLNLFCHETLPGRLFIQMEVLGGVDALRPVLREAALVIDGKGYGYSDPVTYQIDREAMAIDVEVPVDEIVPLLTSSSRLDVIVDLRSPYSPIRATTYLDSGRENLLFAANNCATTLER